jgi:hypothetical protein
VIDFILALLAAFQVFFLSMANYKFANEHNHETTAATYLKWMMPTLKGITKPPRAPYSGQRRSSPRTGY